jgi:hypothetical protein
VVDTPAFETGVRSAKYAVAATSGTLRHFWTATANVYASFYWYSADLPASGNKFMCYLGVSGASAAQLRVATSNFQIRNGNSAQATSSMSAAAATWYRFEFSVVGSTQTLRIFHGANLHGATPDETISGNYTQGNPSNIRLGPYLNPQNLTFEQQFAYIKVNDDAFAAPWSEPPPPPAAELTFKEWDGSAFVDLTVAEWDGSALVPLTVDEIE